MTWIAGADGCRDGWLVVMRRTDSGEITCRVAKTLHEITSWPEHPEILCIDMPIGLLDAAEPGGRVCDRRAREILGPLRGRSVFSAPARPTLGASRYKDALERNRSSSSHGVGISFQCFNILAKITEVDRQLTPELQKRFLEMHPEVTFATLAGGAINAPKKSPGGRGTRIGLLADAWSCSPDSLATLIDHAVRGRHVARDDVVDAMAACLTGERVLRGEELRLPTEAPRDSRGLRMQIVA
jgi:predicted RNase H-like nuclease